MIARPGDRPAATVSLIPEHGAPDEMNGARVRKHSPGDEEELDYRRVPIFRKPREVPVLRIDVPSSRAVS